MNTDRIIELVLSCLTVFISAVSAISVVWLSRQQSEHAKHEKRQEKKNTWYRSEVISEDKLKEHIDVEMRSILNDPNCSKYEMCVQINNAMLAFFYRSVNYIAFFNLKQYNTLKQKIMAETDNLMYSVLIENGPIAGDKAEKILEIYRMKLIYLFYEYEMRFDL